LSVNLFNWLVFLHATREKLVYELVEPQAKAYYSGLSNPAFIILEKITIQDAMFPLSGCLRDKEKDIVTLKTTKLL